ncbi:MAG: DUF1294 domain-containing protein [Terrisporobacter sp.]|uniref:DUF1294 domain-containing protein n=1 Tax=Clostridium sp. TaxID=1506 RepID=UPI0030298B7D
MKILLIYFLIISILTFSLMYIDKHRAIKGEWRISESTLINLSILGGGLGSYMGMYLFKHKTKHPKFTIGIPLTILFNVITYFFILNLM